MLRIAAVALVLSALSAGLAAGAGNSVRVVAKIKTGIGPCSETGGYGAVWVGNYGDSTVARIDPKTNRVTRKIKVGATPCGIGIGAGAVWVDGWGTGAVERIDPRRGKIVKRIKVAGPNALWDVTYGAGSVWGTDYIKGLVLGIDPKTNRVVARIKTGGIALEPPLRRRGDLGRVAVRHLDLPHRPGDEPVDLDRHETEWPRLAGGRRRRRLGVGPSPGHGDPDRSCDERRGGHDRRRRSAGQSCDRGERPCLRPLKGENKLVEIDPATKR